MSSAKRAGAKFESDVLRFLRERSVQAERTHLTGRLDEGDIAFRDADGTAFVVECKARRDRNSSLNLGSWLKEAEAEARHYAAARNLPTAPVPVLVVKRPQASIGESFVIMTLNEFLNG